MAIVKEYYTTRDDGVELYRSYSDQGVYIRKVGTDEIYDEAIDVSDAPYEYEETEIPVDDPDGTGGEDMTEIIEKAKAYDIITGVSV